MNSSGAPIKNSHQETTCFRRRALFGIAGVVVLVLVLSGRFAWLQVIHHADYLTQSDENRIRLRPIVPARGLIYDRNGRLLAENVPAYRLEVVPEQAGDIERTLRELGQVIPFGDEELRRFREARRTQRRFIPIPLKLRLGEPEMARFAVNRHRFPGWEVVPYLTRRYLYGDLFAHVIGYVARIDAEDAATLDPARYSGSTHIGKDGIERFYEDRLHGDVGVEQVEANAEGRVLRVLARDPAASGEHIHLSIDLDLQMAAVAAFAGQPGAAVAIDPRNGEVLALVSLPAYDPNPFVNGIGAADYAALQNESRPLFNRASLGGYAPGSTIKPFVALAALESSVRTPEDTVFSSGAYRIPGQQHEYRDWRKGGHGTVNLREALAQSVNTYFYRIAVDMGIDAFSVYLGRFGFGTATGIDLPGETVGVLPSKQWKSAHRHEPWYLGETVISGIGQGYWVVTPLQLAHAVAAIANGGLGRRPHLLRAAQRGFDAAITRVSRPEPDLPPLASPKNLSAVTAGMIAVMHGPTGTARAAAAGASYLIAGKTGTAQRVSRRGDEAIDVEALPFHLRHRALFIGFAPAAEPTIALAVVVEHGGSGARAAAPVARRILDAWLNSGRVP